MLGPKLIPLLAEVLLFQVGRENDCFARGYILRASDCVNDRWVRHLFLIFVERIVHVLQEPLQDATLRNDGEFVAEIDYVAAMIMINLSLGPIKVQEGNLCNELILSLTR